MASSGDLVPELRPVVGVDERHIEVPTMSSGLHPNISPIARLTSRTTPSMSATPIPTTASSNTAWNRASLLHRACSAAARAMKVEAVICSCSARVRSCSAWA